MALAERVEESLADGGPWPVPEGWAWVPLKRLSSFIGRGRGPTYVDSNGVPVVNQKCIRWRRLEAKHFKQTARSAFVRLAPELHLQAGDLLWNSTGTGTIGRALVYDGSFPELTIDSHVTLVRPVSVLPAYLGYFIETTRVQRLVVDSHVGSTNQRELPRSFVEDLLIPLPPLAEQRRIVARIDALFAEIAEGEAALVAARDGLDTFRRALLKAAVTGELTKDWRAANPVSETGQDFLTRIIQNIGEGAVPKGRSRRAKEPAAIDHSNLPRLPASWAWTRLSTLGEFGRGKSRHRPRDDARLYGGEMPFVQTGIVANSDDYIRTYQQTYSAVGVEQSRVWPPGTLCITIAANIAKTAITTFECCFPDSIVGLTPVRKIDPYWVHIWMKTIQQRLERYAPATAQKNINLEVLDAVMVPIPPPAEAAEILRRVSDAISASADVQALLEAEAADAARLKQSILKAAFEGRLVPQDSTEEPAAALLERLATTGPAPARAKRGRGARSHA
ncbi:restriction endonuclease subunit S [Rhodopseudomonas sp. WA056]|uniref:restriction endonuclease subunit S n=1 Tax=Rhodopseudomonas sp. WA056 TaxID=2269367 RepID=UPI0013E00D39